MEAKKSSRIGIVYFTLLDFSMFVVTFLPTGELDNNVDESIAIQKRHKKLIAKLCFCVDQ